ncbi:MAG: hypothetical protein ACD_3C00143G0003 [uncultured bacterium (gcode 4)]|uniref:Uncharacterized protein n=1 Tax=uncultured bacterium (gcode 4) TaxID=1234023 RepID=K2F9N5_9BACT|nr:MAG: hypothetical protein ACD_3C00143G0003 [uncultured bacterium (gcode 4)]
MMKNSADKTDINQIQPDLANTQTSATVNKVKRNIIFYSLGDSFERGNYSLSIPEASYKEIIEMKRSRIEWLGFEMDIWQWFQNYPSELIFLMN